MTSMDLFSRLVGDAADAAAKAAGGDAEDPEAHRERAAAMRECLREMYRKVSPENARALLALARDLLGGVWAAASSDVARPPGARARVAGAARAWAWGVVGRALGVEDEEARPHTSA